MVKLSAAQKRVMKWLGYGWSASPHNSSSSFEVNGQKVCNIDTLTSLKNKGLVKETENGQWVATDEGVSLTGRLCL